MLKIYIQYILLACFLAYSFYYNRSYYTYISIFSLYLIEKDRKAIFQKQISIYGIVKSTSAMFVLFTFSVICITYVYDKLIPLPMKMEEFNWVDTDRVKINTPSIYHNVLAFLHMVIAVPIVEELLHRRFLVGYFRDKGLPISFLVLISVAFFTLNHCDFGPWNIFGKYFISYLPMAIIFTYIYLKHGLAASIVTHITWNLSQVVKPTFIPLILASLAILIGFGVYNLTKRFRKKVDYNT